MQNEQKTGRKKDVPLMFVVQASYTI